VVDGLRRRLGAGRESSECGSLVSVAGGLLLARPQTFMNRSGWAIRCLVDRHEVGDTDLLVIYDDVSLPLGRLRARAFGGPGGHRGMESILENLRTDRVPRLRLGIAPPDAVEEELSEFVLAPFTSDEVVLADELVDRAVDAVALWLSDGLGPVMDRYNG
jgi:PTH1 family peptidyl-tRNA hydrolase